MDVLLVQMTLVDSLGDRGAGVCQCLVAVDALPFDILKFLSYDLSTFVSFRRSGGRLNCWMVSFQDD